MKLWISPHNDDSVLFGAFTLIREKPLVLTVTDSFIQQNRGEKITPDQRRIEDIEAMKVLGCSIIFGGIRDDVIDDWALRVLFSKFKNFETVYIPAPIIPGNIHHNLISQVASEIFPEAKQYMTYSATKLYMEGNEEVKPTPEELKLKDKALSCYVSQINLPATSPHFKAVEGHSEWFI